MVEQEVSVARVLQPSFLMSLQTNILPESCEHSAIFLSVNSLTLLQEVDQDGPLHVKEEGHHHLLGSCFSTQGLLRMLGALG